MDLINRLPPFYALSEEIKNIQQAFSLENDIIKKDIEDFKKQFFVKSCTWALPLWEKYVGIVPNETIAADLRKKRVIAKLSGQGTCTREKLLEICKAYSGVSVEIIDRLQQYYITIKFKGTKIEKLETIKEIINEIKPAWLGIEYIATEKLLVSEVDIMPIEEFENHTVSQFAFYIIVSEIDSINNLELSKQNIETFRFN